MPTLTLQPGPGDCQDTYLSRNAPDTVYGTSTRFWHRALASANGYHPILKFDLSDLPPEAVILSVKLYLWDANGAGDTLTLHRILAANDNWSESSTWNYRVPTTERWAGDAGGDGGADAGCSQSGTDYAAATMGSVAIQSATTQEYEITLDLDEFALMRADNHGFTLTPSVAGNEFNNGYLYSGDEATNPERRPKLVIEWEYPYEIKELTLEIGGVDVTDYLLKETMNIVDALGKEVDTARFTLEDWDSSLALSGWQEVIIKDEDNVVHFGGYLREVVRRPYRGQTLQLDCRCEDYSCLFSHEGINTDYTGETDAAIIADMFSNLVAHDGFDATTNVSSSGVQNHIRFNRISLAEAMRELSARTGYDWYVDANKAIWYFDPTVGAGAADWHLSDNADGVDTFLYDEDSVQDTVDDTDIRSRIYVYGGNYESDPITQRWTADGVADTFWLAYQPKTVTEVTVNAVVQTVGLDYVDNPNDYDCLVNYVEKIIKFYGGPPTNGHVVTCTYTYEVPVAVTRQDEPSFLHYGRYFDYTLVDRKIGSIQEAREAADALLAKYAMGVNVVQVSTHRLGLRSGEIVNFTNSLLGYNDDPFLIQSVSKTLNAAGYVVCNLALGEHRGTIIDWMLQAQITKADDLDYREAEMLRLIIEPTGETVEISETPTVTLTLPGIYTWGADADELTWNYGTWG